MIPKSTDGALRWNVIALALAGPALLGTILWIIHLLAPAQWCSIVIVGAKEAQRTASDCTPILLALLGIHRDLIWIIGGTLGLVICAIGLAATRMTFTGSIGAAQARMGSDKEGDNA